jgi:hypothetical protein
MEPLWSNVKNATDAKWTARMFGRRWDKEGWILWNAHLKSIGVYYDKELRQYVDVKPENK